MSQFVRFLLVGGFNTGLGYLLIFGCMYLFHLSAELSNAIGYGCGLLISYILNRNFTFNSRERHRGTVPRFLMVFALAYGINFFTLLILLHYAGLHAVASQIIAGVFYVVASYTLNKLYVFKDSKKPVVDKMPHARQ